MRPRKAILSIAALLLLLGTLVLIAPQRFESESGDAPASRLHWSEVFEHDRPEFKKAIGECRRTGYSGERCAALLEVKGFRDVYLIRKRTPAQVSTLKVEWSHYTGEGLPGILRIESPVAAKEGETRFLEVVFPEGVLISQAHSDAEWSCRGEGRVACRRVLTEKAYLGVVVMKRRKQVAGKNLLVLVRRDGEQGMWFEVET